MSPDGYTTVTISEETAEKLSRLMRQYELVTMSKGVEFAVNSTLDNDNNANKKGSEQGKDHKQDPEKESLFRKEVDATEVTVAKSKTSDKLLNIAEGISKEFQSWEDIPKEEIYIKLNKLIQEGIPQAKAVRLVENEYIEKYNIDEEDIFYEKNEEILRKTTMGSPGWASSIRHS